MVAQLLTFTKILYLYTYNDLILWYVNFTSIKLLRNGKKNSDHKEKFP